MSEHKQFVEKIEVPEHRERVREVLNFIKEEFPQLKEEYKWSQPMFSDHGTFIIGFSVAKGHMAVTPEFDGIIHFADRIDQAKYSRTDMIFRIKWSDDVDYDLLRDIVEFKIEDKKDYDRFWR